MEIKIQHLSFQYTGSDQQALQDVNLTIPSGQHIALIGHNGSGKTTLARCIKGLVKPSSGKILFNGKSIEHEKISALAHKVGFVFQHPDDQIFHQTVYQEVAYGPKILGIPPEIRDEKIKQALILTGLDNEKSTHPYDLGYSGRKRITIASTLAMDTDIIIFDEPTSGMDNYELDLMQKIYQDLQSRNKTIISITHDFDLALEQSDRLAIMSAGKIIREGDPTLLFSEMNADIPGMITPQMIRLSNRVLKNRHAKNVRQFVDMVKE